MNGGLKNYRAGLLVLSLLGASVGMLMIPPIPQDPLYHLFADTRSCLGLLNFGDVTSNLGFVVAGFWGLFKTSRAGKSGLALAPDLRNAFMCFFLAIILIAPGSAYYHSAPDNTRLFWDRLPMILAFMSLFAVILGDRINPAFVRKNALAGFLLLGIAALGYWYVTELTGGGDLRPYFLVQFYPMLAIPLICWLYPAGRHTKGKYLVWMYFWYVLAKILEYFDAEIFASFGSLISGHSLKHLAAALAVLMVAGMLGNCPKKQAS
ncbi:hypothetical protein O4H49_11955 [Kiloniella laminariae]|uniref:Alkaline phytoceramidase n=1 Tax=Kiloniella laminariae TaxID=454162 RepID=A0ABT4LK84_9PROT|nr:hypothetical protein [Kiloniella laminariae]MCZ4281496.1 hypothetical protein [Kiloniella laminariae]